MESDWRAIEEIENSAGRNIIISSDCAVLDSKIADQRDHEAARHGIDELDRIPIAY